MAETVLVVDDDPQVRVSTHRILVRDGFRVEEAANPTIAFELLGSVPIDLVLLDLHLGDVTGIEVLQQMRGKGLTQPVLMISGDGTIAEATKAVRLGALDFLEKPVVPERLVLTLRNALRVRRLEQDNADLSAALTPGRLVGNSPVMQNLRALIERAAQSDARILISGENGTGKELVAEALHAGSQRSGKQLVKINCAAIPENLIESELFGHERGAFTGATAARRGHFEVADGGTLFLDEVGDMSAAVQVKVLRVLESGELIRVGGNTPIAVDVRVVAATNAKLEAMVADGRFREDLFYRLNVVRLETPPLRDRREDIAELAEVFLGTVSKKHRRAQKTFSADALRRLAGYDFPGNVRELQNLVERLVILSDGPVIEIADLQRILAISPPAQSAASGAPLYRSGVPFHELVDSAQRQIIEAALAEHQHRMAETARALGLERSHFYKKCKSLGIEI